MNDFRNIISFNNEYLYLDTGMNDRDFSRSGFTRILDIPGLYMHFEKEYGDTPISFSEWRFIHTKMNKNFIVYGQRPDIDNNLQWISLYECVIDGRWDIVFETVKFLESAYKTGINKDIPVCGPFGILVGIDNKQLCGKLVCSLLFLPTPLFPRIISAYGNEFSYNFIDKWINHVLKGEDSLVYTCAVCLYKIFSGIFPQDEKNNGYADIIPLEIVSFNIDKKIADIVNRSLGVQSNHISKKNHHNLPTLTELCEALPQTYNECFTNNNSEVNFNKKKEDFIKRNYKKTELKHFLRKKGTFLSITGIALVVIIVFTSIHINDLKGKPSTLGMTPIEVVDAFYSSFESFNQELASACVINGVGDAYTSMLTSLYVVNKVREAYEHRIINVSPQQWITMENPDTVSVFGIMYLNIDESHQSTESNPQYIVDFYLLNPQKENPDDYYPFTITKHQDLVTLTYKKNRWRISSLEQKQVSSLSQKSIEELITRYSSQLLIEDK